MLTYVFCLPSQLMERENLRVIDLFHRLDDDNSFSLTRSEFKQGILVSVKRV